MQKAYRYKLPPNRQQKYALARTLDVCRELYNNALYQRTLYKTSRFEQAKQLTELKAAFPVYRNVYSQVLQHVLNKLDKAFRNFFRSEFGFPRYKSERRFDSFTYPQSGFSLEGNHLNLAKIGNIKVGLSRPLPKDAKINAGTVKRTVNGWFVCVAFEYEPTPLPENDKAVGIDVGVATFATFSDGTEIPNPRIYQQSEKKLRRAQRRVARRKKGSNRRRKTIVLLRKIHSQNANKRSGFLHKHSTAVIRNYGTIVVEALNVAGMSRSRLAKQILDCSWAEWFRQLSYKAAEAGRTFVAIDPQYTSQTCPECGFVHPDNRKTQANFVCLCCGHTDGADHNAAVNMLAWNQPSYANVVAVMAT